MLIKAMKFKTIQHFDEPGHAHELTFSCFQKRDLFISDTACNIFVEAVNGASNAYNFDVIAYVIMPNHVHLLICPQNDNYLISKILSGVKLPVSMRMSTLYRNKTGKPLGRFWQRGGGYDRNMVAKEAIISSINYIHCNPIRKGLCINPEDWKWSSARFYAGMGNCSIKISNDALAQLS